MVQALLPDWTVGADLLGKPDRLEVVFLWEEHVGRILLVGAGRIVMPVKTSD
jgi:hypothetical protein